MSAILTPSTLASSSCASNPALVANINSNPCGAPPITQCASLPTTDLCKSTAHRYDPATANLAGFKGWNCVSTQGNQVCSQDLSECATIVGTTAIPGRPGPLGATATTPITVPNFLITTKPAVPGLTPQTWSAATAAGASAVQGTLSSAVPVTSCDPVTGLKVTSVPAPTVSKVLGVSTAESVYMAQPTNQRLLQRMLYSYNR